MLNLHNEQMRQWIRDDYARADLERLQQFLIDAGAFRFPVMKTGLFPAADLPSPVAAKTGYGNVWVRDTVHVAHALALAGRSETADGAVLALARFYGEHRARFFDIVEGRVSPLVAMNRPHVRFNGAEFVEDAQIWPHAQNDALGVFLWFYAQRACAGAFVADFSLIEMFALYFAGIAYWRDADSGHWEERAKVEASSIGCIVAALKQVRALREKEPAPPWRRGFGDATLDRLIEAGEQALDEILPWECRGPEPILQRRYDAALLFLIYPLDVVSPAMADQIAADVVANLQGEHGVRRYLGDSYWTADYKQKLDAKSWTGDFSVKQAERDKLAMPGEEAQWSLFDPILSAIAGRRYLHTRDEQDRRRQIEHFNRALGQLTGPECPAGALKCPEAYYLENGRYVPNDHVPLLWTQANLLAAFVVMKETSS